MRCPVLLDHGTALGPATLAAGRAHGQRLAQDIGNDGFARCAWLSAEVGTSFSHQVRKTRSASELARARDEYIAFLENVLAGRVRVEKSAYQLHSVVGQLYLDKGFALLPESAKAALPFEAGAHHLLQAASGFEDERHIELWERYSFMLNKLPIA